MEFTPLYIWVGVGAQWNSTQYCRYTGLLVAPDLVVVIIKTNFFQLNGNVCYVFLFPFITT